MVYPQQEQRLDDGKNGSTAMRRRPAHSLLYLSCRMSSDQPASAMLFANCGLRIMFFTLSDSTHTTWFSLMSVRDNLCRLSRRQSAIFACNRATFWRALVRFFEPSCFLLNRRCSNASRLAFLAVLRGLSALNPLSVTNRRVRPTSIPTIDDVTGNGSGWTSHRQLTKYRPAESLLTVTVEGDDGSLRDQRMFRGVLLFAMYRCPSRYLKALAVNSATCLWRLDLKAGYEVRPSKKFLKAVCWWRKHCWSGTHETSFNQANSGVLLRMVNRALVWA
ncbi:Uncharacterised protein [Serratia marcescens]|nr:hypothetical protein SMKC032_48160 [Serratia marcescens]CAI1561163.1 Uncharacterised protein [Serratia marcescens]CAI2107878.1 Uncharacterised protein [Serratia marcescens]CVC77002.1 Uncharacterised protein [Serratia marcescens]